MTKYNSLGVLSVMVGEQIKQILVFCILLIPLLATSILVYQGGWFYFDHSMYVLLGKAFWSGQVLYVDAWDHHPPGMYILIGALAKVFGTNQSVFIALNTLCYLALIGLYTKFAKLIHIDQYKISGAIIFSVLSTLFLFGVWNSEQIYAPVLAVTALLCFKYLKSQSDAFFDVKKLVLFSGIAGVLLLFKVQAWIEVVGLIALTGLLIETKITLRLVRFVGLFVLYSVTPLAIWMTWYGAGFVHNFDSIVLYNFAYIDSPSASSGGKSALVSIFKICVLLCVLAWVYYKSNPINPVKLTGSWILGWFAISLFASTLSGRLYPHYFVQFLIPATLLIFFVYEFYRRKLRYGEYWIGVTVGMVLIGYALFSQVNNSTIAEGDRFGENIPTVITTAVRDAKSYKDSISCRAFESTYYCTDMINQARRLVPGGSKLLVASGDLGTYDAGVYIDLTAEPVTPYYSDTHAIASKVGPWQSSLHMAEYIIVSNNSKRAPEIVSYTSINCKTIYTNPQTSLYDCTNK